MPNRLRQLQIRAEEKNAFFKNMINSRLETDEIQKANKIKYFSIIFGYSTIDIRTPKEVTYGEQE